MMDADRREAGHCATAARCVFWGIEGLISARASPPKTAENQGPMAPPFDLTKGLKTEKTE